MLRLLHTDGKMEENGTEFPVNNKASVVGKASDRMKKINDVENDGYQGRNFGCDGSQTSCNVTQWCKLKIQQRDDGNSVARNNVGNAQDCLLEAHDNHEQNLC